MSVWSTSGSRRALVRTPDTGRGWGSCPHTHDGHGHDGHEADGHDADDGGGPPELSRRVFIGGLGVGALGLLIPALGWATTSRELRRSSSSKPFPGKNPYRLAMHVHSSFSEGVGSMYAQLTEAARTGHDLVFFTEHDWRKKGLDHLRRGIHFSGASEYEDPAGTWMWTNRVEGSPAARSQSWVSSPSSPVEPGPASLQLGHHADQRHRLQPLRRRRQQIEQGRPGQRVGPTAPGRRPGRPSVGQRLVGSSACTSRSTQPWVATRRIRTLSYRFGTVTGRSRRRLEPPARHRVDARARGDLDDRGAAAARRPHRDLHRAARPRPTTRPRRRSSRTTSC